MTACTRGASWRRCGSINETGIGGATNAGSTSTSWPDATSASVPKAGAWISPRPARAAAW